ncbi:MAG: hypothetical protein SF182_26480, partial [Deltaproteobacteria bacterium]|nr:hypothetical protein [Deltaproteobacteria bacterium]
MSRVLHGAALVALCAAAWVVMLRLGGGSPIIWIDTFNDEREVRQCLGQNSCTLTGVTTSIPGLTHAVAWLQLRTVLAGFGVGLDGAHRAVQLLAALGAALLFHLAVRLGGGLAGAAAVWLYLDRIDAMLRASALYNSSLLLFLGAVLLLACVAVVERPGAGRVTLAALVAALLANVQLACVLSGASVV